MDIDIRAGMDGVRGGGLSRELHEHLFRRGIVEPGSQTANGQIVRHTGAHVELKSLAGVEGVFGRVSMDSGDLQGTMRRQAANRISGSSCLIPASP
jgi:hypothetical protein